MAQQALARRKHEQIIKNRLCNIEFEDPQSPTLKYPTFFAQRTQRQRKKSDFPELSDWTSHAELPQPHLTQRKKFYETPEEKDLKRFTFFNPKRYPSSLLLRDKNNSRLQLSPVVVKFNAKVLSQNLQKSKEKYIKKLKEDPYLTHYQSSALGRNMRSKQKIKGPQFKQIKFQGGQQDEKKERMTGILRMLKKQVPFRSRPHKPINPQVFNATTRLF